MKKSELQLVGTKVVIVRPGARAGPSLRTRTRRLHVLRRGERLSNLVEKNPIPSWVGDLLGGEFISITCECCRSISLLS